MKVDEISRKFLIVICEVNEHGKNFKTSKNRINKFVILWKRHLRNKRHANWIMADVWKIFWSSKFSDRRIHIWTDVKRCKIIVF